MTENEKADLADLLLDLHGTECGFLTVVESLPESVFGQLSEDEVNDLAVEIHDMVVDG